MESSGGSVDSADISEFISKQSNLKPSRRNSLNLKSQKGLGLGNLKFL